MKKRIAVQENNNHVVIDIDSDCSTCSTSSGFELADRETERVVTNRRDNVPELQSCLRKWYRILDCNTFLKCMLIVSVLSIGVFVSKVTSEKGNS